MFGRALRWMGRRLAEYLNGPTCDYEPFAVTPMGILAATLRPGDVLLVEGDRRVSVPIKYLTQSTWSHAALYVGDALPAKHGADGRDWLIEADLIDGVKAVPLSVYRNFNTRICRPLGLSAEDRRAVVRFAVDRIGLQYDLKNVIDLMRYLVPTPPVPTRWRRRMLHLGSGDPTRAICSTLLAQAFQSVRYPILPYVSTASNHSETARARAHGETFRTRHHSLFTPRDFDVSPYFQVVKPTLEMGFNYRHLQWDASPVGYIPDRPSECANPTLAAKKDEAARRPG